MVKHIVCFKLKDRKKSEEAKEILLSMRGKVPTAQEIEVGVDFLDSARSYDVFLSVTVRDGQALTEYQNDPYHVGVVKKFMHEETENSVAVEKSPAKIYENTKKYPLYIFTNREKCDIIRVSMKSEVTIMAHKITDECVACGACADTCPVGAISLGDAGIYVVDPETCVDCGACEDVCPTGAVKAE